MEDPAATPLPNCFCNWKNCRTYQEALREYKHPILNGVVELTFTKNDGKSLALKSSVDRTLHVDATKRNDWTKLMEQNELTCRYYVARHHFTEALMKQYISDRPRSWDWNELLTLKQAKTFLWSLDRRDVYLSEWEEEGDDDTRYVQSPNVPEDHVRELLTDTLKAFEDTIGHQELATKDIVLAQKEEENILRHDGEWSRGQPFRSSLTGSSLGTPPLSPCEPRLTMRGLPTKSSLHDYKYFT